jgi:drug/metabolite transporter superfamily protein YnfA
MNTLTLSSFVIAILGSLAGFYAAYLWWKASRTSIQPTWTVEPGEAQLAQQGWVVGIMNNVQQSAELNKRAAFWTGVGVLLGAASVIVNTLAGVK